MFFYDKDKDKDKDIEKFTDRHSASWSSLPMSAKIFWGVIIIIFLGLLIYNIFQHIYCFAKGWEGRFCKGLILQDTAAALSDSFGRGRRNRY